MHIKNLDSESAVNSKFLLGLGNPHITYTIIYKKRKVYTFLFYWL